MWKLGHIILLSSGLKAIIAAEKPPPRGVGPDFAKFFISTESFSCISNPSITIPSSHVNDDYCDCPDGSDEPGTSACSYLSKLSPSSLSDVSIGDPNISISLPGYYCQNYGHQPSYIPSLSVNDGICDYSLCCDGSDEWARVGGITCENKCKEIGKEWRKHDKQRQQSLSNASKRRKQLVSDAAKMRKEVEDRIQTLETEIGGSVIKVKDLEIALAEVEKKERGKVVKNPGKGGKTNILVGLAKDRIEELRVALINVREQRDDASSRVKELEALLSTFKEEYNPNFNDEGVKRAVRSWEEYAAREKSSLDDSASDRDLDEIVKTDEESDAIPWAEFEESDDSDVDVLYKFEEYLPKPLRDWVDQKLRDLRLILIENGIIAASRDSSSESKDLTDARDALKAAQGSLENSQSQLSSHKEDLENDYGQDDVFRALKGQCISKDSGEYIYELCWFDKTKQKSKKGGSETAMGNFVRIDTITVDEEVSPDGRGLGSGERVALRYENGQHCWNGPTRSTLVVLACAESDEVWKIVEEEKCVYRMEVGTSAVCGIGTYVEGKASQRDEL